MATKSKRSKAVKKVIAAPSRTRKKNLIGDRMSRFRGSLNMPREDFGRMINASVRTIAEIESGRRTELGKLSRSYNEVERLYDALSEVVDPECLDDWFKSPNEAFGGFKPVEIIERGEIDRLWGMIYRLESGMPG